MPSLNECLLKLKWADKGFQRFQTDFTKFEGSKPYDIVVKKSAEEGFSFLQLKILEPWPEDFSLRLGEIVYNLRASLDYLAWQLSLLTKPDLVNMPTYTSPVTNIEFPIFIKKHQGAISERVKFIPPAAVAEIEKLQPYNRGNGADGDWLAVLHSLSNRDKHRQLTPVELLIRRETRRNGQLIAQSRYFVPFQDDALVALLPSELIDEPDGNFQMQAAFEVLFDKRGPTGGFRVSSFKGLNDYIRDIVFPKFACFF